MEQFTPSLEQQRAIDAILDFNQRYLYIFGGAGVGKSYVIESVKHHIAEADNLNVAFLAPTGKAATNINGDTIHSFFGLPATVLIPSGLPAVTGKLEELLNKVDMIVIDEISMVRADTFTAIDRRLREATSNLNTPFGGKKIVLLGDHLQLPPVVTEEDKHILYRYFQGFDIFATDAWLLSGFRRVELSEVQ